MTIAFKISISYSDFKMKIVLKVMNIIPDLLDTGTCLHLAALVFMLDCIHGAASGFPLPDSLGAPSKFLSAQLTGLCYIITMTGSCAGAYDMDAHSQNFGKI